MKDFVLRQTMGAQANRAIKERLRRQMSGETVGLSASMASLSTSSKASSRNKTTLHKKGVHKEGSNLPELSWSGGEVPAKEFRRLMEAKFYDEAREKVSVPVRVLARVSGWLAGWLPAPSHRGWVVQLGVGVESGGGQLVRRPPR